MFCSRRCVGIFLKAAERARSARIADAKYCAQPGMTERSQWSNVGALSYSRRDACRLPGSRVGGASICFDDLGAPGWSPPAIDPVHSCGPSEGKTDVCASAFPARAEMSITVRRSGFYEAAQAATCAVNEEASNFIAGLDPAIHLLTKVDGYAGQARV
jgi:hypothetical protein